jgi:hypothetical protein
VLRQGFWVKVELGHNFAAKHFCNGDICKEFEVNESYINPLPNRPQPSFRGVVNCCFVLF